jgi:hypothetical protein
MKQIREITEQEVREAMQEKHRIIRDVVVLMLSRWEDFGYYRVCIPAEFGLPDSHVLEWYCVLLLARTHPKSELIDGRQFWLCDLVRSSDELNVFKVHPKVLVPMSVDELEAGWQSFLEQTKINAEVQHA